MKLPIEAGATYVFDNGYCDYTWWHRIDQAGAFFVTRFKHNAALQVAHTRPLDAVEASPILKDEIVVLSNRNPGGGRKQPYRQPLRRVTVARPDHPTPLVLASNDLTSPASTIAEHYTARWGIKLYFKWVKQHLKIKTFLGRSRNAVHIQILTALIAYLLLTRYRQSHRYAGTLWALLAEVRATLFQRPGIEHLGYQRRRDAQLEFARLQKPLFV